MGIGDAREGVLTVSIGDDASIAVDVGSRFVEVGPEDLERIVDRLAAEGGTLRVLGAPDRADDGDEPPDREADPAVAAASWVVGLAQARGVTIVRDAR